MIMADVLKIVLLIVGALIVLVSYWLAAVALTPTTVERARREYEARPLRATLLGTFAGAPLTAAGIALLTRAGLPPAQLLGGAVLSVLVLCALAGSAGLAERIGRGLPSSGDERQPWKRVLRGGAVLSLTMLLPVVGWFIVLPLTLLSGFGAGLLALRRQREPATSRTPVTPIPGVA